jgi:acyl-CoA synthetase (AMP-forming)/AMP-acid ligase II
VNLPPAPLSRLSAGHWIGAVGACYPERPAFVTDAGARTFATVAARVNRLARAMRARGLEKGDRLAIVATDSVEHIEVVLACLATGVVFCDLNFRLRPGELAAIVAMAEPSWIVVEARYAGLADELRGQVEPRPQLVLIDGHPADPWSVQGMIADIDDPSEVEVQAHGEDIVSIAFTSGTTGIPKGVLQSERMIRSMVYSCIHEARVRNGSFRYNGPPLFHLAGIGAALYGMVAGATTLILPQFEAPVVLRWLQHGGITDTLLVPTMLSSLLQQPDVGACGYDDLRTILYGGAPMTPALLRRVIEVFDCDLFNLFGAGTEAGGQATLYPEDHVAALEGRPELLESVGRVIPGVQVRLVGDDLVEVPRGELGEILVRTETSMSGYLGQPELTAHTVVDGWIRTGDVARMDADGYLFLASRRTEIIIRGGENIYPNEVEGVLEEEASVRAAAVVGWPDAHWGELVVAVVAPSGPGGVDAHAAMRRCVERLAGYKVPSRLVVVDDLPTTSAGKVDRRAVRDLVRSALDDDLLTSQIGPDTTAAGSPETVSDEG